MTDETNQAEDVEARTVNVEPFTSSQVMQGDADQFALMVRNEIDIQVATAKHYPRDVEKSTKRAIASIVACDGLAEQCIYSLPRGGKNIQGPSIRMAEVMLHHWGNTRIICRTVAEHEDHIEVEAWAMDLEQNVGVSIPIRRRIIDSYGKRYNSDMINTTTMAALKIAFRNAVLALVPPFVTQEVYKRAKRHAVGDLKDLPARWKKALTKWLTIGVTEEMLLKHLEIETSGDLSIEDFEYMIGLFNAINDGDIQKDPTFAKTKTERTGTKASASVDELADEMGGESDSPKDPAPTKAKAKSKAKTKAKAKAKPKPDTKTDPDPNAQPPDEKPVELGPDDYLLDERVEPMFDAKQVSPQGRDAMIRQALEDGLTPDELLEQINDLPEPEEGDPITIDDGPGGTEGGEGGEQTEIGDEDESLY